MPKLIVAARREGGITRAGRRWSPTPAEVEVTEQVAELLRKEPMLVVTETSAVVTPEALATALEGLPAGVRDALKRRFSDEVLATREPLVKEIGQLRQEAEDLREQLAEAKAEQGKLRAKVAELERAGESAARPPPAPEQSAKPVAEPPAKPAPEHKRR